MPSAHKAWRPTAGATMPDRPSETRLLSATAVIGEVVCNLDGEPLGEIRDIVVDIQQGCVTYAVLSFGGLLGLGNKLFPVPWELIAIGDDEGLVLDLPAERLERAPGFDRDHWPDMADPAWIAAVQSYYQTGGKGPPKTR